MIKFDIENNKECTLTVLWEMKEWMAYGFYEALELPWPQAYGRAFLRLYENMELRMPVNRLLIPCEPFNIEESLKRKASEESYYWHVTEQNAHHPTGYLFDFMHSYGLHTNNEMMEIKKKQYPQYSEFIDSLIEDLNKRQLHSGGYTHSNPDIRRVVEEGFDAMVDELDRELASAKKENLPVGSNELSLLLSLKEYTDGVRTFHRRTVEMLEKTVAALEGEAKRRLSLVLENLRQAFIKPSVNFIQGLLAVNFAWMLDGCDSIGRVDQVLGSLFEKDIQSGSIELSFARELIDEFLKSFELINGWNLQIGGYRPDGNDGCNLLTKEIIIACNRNKIRKPNIAFRITRHTPDSLFQLALEALSNGSGKPALYNDDLYVESLLNMDLGLTPEDAREIGFGGCTETMIAGMSNVGSLEGTINLAKTLELALYDGYDPINKQQSGPHTGRFESFATYQDFEGAYKKQIRYLTEKFVTYSNEALSKRFTSSDPKLFRTFFTRDCVKNRKSFEAGGARYNWSVVSYEGIANMIDSLAAIKKYVFEDKSIRAEVLIEALKNNLHGFEDVLHKLKAAPKYGNDIDEVDSIGRDILDFAWRELNTHETPRGGRYMASCILFVTYEGAGRYVGALPDGHREREVLADSTGPAQGRDTHGPTAMLNSVAKLPLHLAVGTPVLNIRLQKRMLSDEIGMQAYINLIKTYFSNGGLQIQVSVLSREDMLAAQKEPEKYRDLIVRVGGYSEYFTNLTKGLQDSVLARVEY